ncbi:hypothetical protein FBU30_007456, partial [Linnemannia zychae]
TYIRQITMGIYETLKFNGDSHKQFKASNPSNWQHEQIIHAAVYEAVMKYEEEHKNDRTFSLDDFCAHAAKEADKLCEIKGLNAAERESARKEAESLALLHYVQDN